MPVVIDSGSLSTASVTLSNSRLSYYALVSGAHGIGASTITIQGSGNPDNNTNHLFPNDSVAIGSNAPQTVATISATTQFQTTTGITNILANGNAVYATQSATHSVAVTTVDASDPSGGAIRVLVPAGDSTTASNNKLPDGGATPGFDFGGLIAGDVTCPTQGGAGVTWETATATASSTFGSNLHAIECRWRGILPATTALTMTIGSTNKLINPAPKSVHTQGLADTYIIKIQELAYATGYGVMDSVSVTVSPVEAVLVSATINPSLTFQVAGIASGVSRCGVSTTVGTTATTVPYGELTGSDTYYHAAQQISTSTNSPNGYTVKVAEDDELTKLGTATTIADTTCNAGTCTHTTFGKWNTSSIYGWGYSLENSSATSIAFEHNTNSGACDGTSGTCSKNFACNTTSCSVQDTEQTVANSSAPSSTQTFYLCYRLNYGPTQATGYYQTKVLYYASAVF